MKHPTEVLLVLLTPDKTPDWWDNWKWNPILSRQRILQHAQCSPWKLLENPTFRKGPENRSHFDHWGRVGRTLKGKSPAPHSEAYNQNRHIRFCHVRREMGPLGSWTIGALWSPGETSQKIVKFDPRNHRCGWCGSQSLASLATKHELLDPLRQDCWRDLLLVFRHCAE